MELLSNTVPTSYVVALEPNEERVNAMVDGPNNEMVDVAANAKPGDVGRSVFGPGDVVVALSAGEKGEGSVPSSTIEEVVAPP
ncbi:hypothetical protein Tco_0575536 [Tanacetum coccineum]